MDKVVLAEKLARVAAPWQPHVVGQVNDTMVKVVKLAGEFVWHHHEHEDELFLVVAGRLLMKLRDPAERDLWLEPGELVIIPRGVEHCPVAADGAECHVVLVEPATTLNTGNVRSERTVEQLERI
ncbi:MAG: cupin domain-containing protein [Kofleriaceae bacterium]|nr:MAG: cupin domain-containing protein [Kofleriaceae bacterium]